MIRLTAVAGFAASLVVAGACTTQTVVPPVSPPVSPSASPPVTQATASPRPAGSPTPPSPQPSPAIEHPTGATDVLLRMSEYSMPYPGMTLLSPTVFSLYGDGRAIYNMSREPYGPGARLDLRQAQLTEGQTDELLADALGPGGLADAKAEYRFTEFTDLTYTYFEIDAAGLDKLVMAYALGSEAPDRVGDVAAHRALSGLALRLRNFVNDVASEKAMDAGAFVPDSYEAKLSVVSHPELAPNQEWPWADLAPSDFARAPDGTLLGIVSAAQAQVVVDASGYPDRGFIASGPDGLNYVFRVQPLLPDEI